MCPLQVRGDSYLHEFLNSICSSIQSHKIMQQKTSKTSTLKPTHCQEKQKKI